MKNSKITKHHIEELDKQIEIVKSLLSKLQIERREADKALFVQEHGKPVWEDNYTKFSEPKLNCSKAHETETEYMDTGTVSTATREPVSVWVCKHCKTPIRKKFIATGHDHTDYSYDVCDCDGPGKPYNELQ